MGDLVISQRCMCVALAPAPGCSRLDDDSCAAGHRHFDGKTCTVGRGVGVSFCAHRLTQRATCTMDVVDNGSADLQ